ncbi:nitrogen permease regulator 2-domain-containing protein [Suillus subaureus]|uniref:Nitrogen permease regulator 2-domain-containing protein n=1 Tax=Suillus subaureus TaxID=48587 RepID=A0A9P7JK99_9AGAM|nr:nitrogen permease regulator 2-domain-containing protein [Suillus subaureus]KAG1827127.1 nitrogen permease regulator 2-domain-containing protein [Suillus subaureus]
MPSEGDTFLPRIQSVFYAVFDLQKGPKIVYQVPEGLITGSTANQNSNHSVTSSPSPSIAAAILEPEVRPSRRSSPSVNSHGGRRASSLNVPSPHQRSSSSSRVLFNFDDISKYVIPPGELCGRLVICATRKYRIMGFPVLLPGNYQRNYFQYNVCFVFERSADLSCYEPVVRKVSREESCFLSCSKSSPAMHAVLEQLYEDLNSYSETSIPIDAFNSIELKIFPFYPNPPPVKDWQVPLALINLSKRIEDNWDLTMSKVCRHIDGVNHVSRIAHLSDCDIELTRQAISHLLYYQVIMTVDIFQYSNMYTLRKNVQWLADECHVKDECGLYVTKHAPGRVVPDWPKLLRLYSRLKSGKTVLDWMETYNVSELGIDVRRFTSFGVIKGFLRRVHRWPILLPADVPSPTRRRRQSLSSSPSNASPTSSSAPIGETPRFSGRPDAFGVAPMLGSPINQMEVTRAQQRTSAAEKVLEQLRFKTLPRAGPSPIMRQPPLSPEGPERNHERRSRVMSDTRRHSTYQQPTSHVPPPSSVAGSQSIAHRHSSESQNALPARPRPSRSPSTSRTRALNSQSSSGPMNAPPPPELSPLLDGDHHTDELCTRFEVGWPQLRQWLVTIGGGKGDEDGDFGRVSIIYR